MENHDDRPGVIDGNEFYHPGSMIKRGNNNRLAVILVLSFL